MKLKRITFGSKLNTVYGKTVSETAEKKCKGIIEMRNGAELTDEEKLAVYESIMSQQQGEKRALKSLCETYASQVEKSLETIRAMQDIIVEIKDADTHINFMKQDLEKLLKAIPKLAPQQIEFLMEYQDLCKQLEKPEEVELGEKKTETPAA